MGDGVANVAAVSLGIGYPTVASAPHSLVNGMKNLLAVAAATEITFKEAEMVKAFLENPDAFAGPLLQPPPLLKRPLRLPPRRLNQSQSPRATMTWEWDFSTRRHDDRGMGLLD